MSSSATIAPKCAEPFEKMRTKIQILAENIEVLNVLVSCAGLSEAERKYRLHKASTDRIFKT